MNVMFLAMKFCLLCTIKFFIGLMFYDYVETVPRTAINRFPVSRWYVCSLTVSLQTAHFIRYYGSA
jgi:hypothetical protein